MVDGSLKYSMQYLYINVYHIIYVSVASNSPKQLCLKVLEISCGLLMVASGIKSYIIEGLLIVWAVTRFGTLISSQCHVLFIIRQWLIDG